MTEISESQGEDEWEVLVVSWVQDRGQPGVRLVSVENRSGKDVEEG